MLDRGRDQRGGLGLLPFHRQEPERCDRRQLTPGRRRHRVALRNEDAGGRQVSVPDLVQRQRRDIGRQLREGAGASNNPGLALEDRARPVGVPRRSARHRRCPPPSQDVLFAHLCVARSPPAARSAWQRLARLCASGRALPAEDSWHPGLPGTEGGLRWLDRSRGRRPRPRGARRQKRRTVSGQVGPASELEVECLELSRGVQEERGSVIAVAANHGDVAAKQCGPRGLEPVERRKLQCGQKPLRRVELSCPKAQLAPRRARAPFADQGRPSTPTARCRNAAAAAMPPRACARPAESLELERDLFVGPGGGPGAVPGAPIRVPLGVGCFGQGAMHPMTVVGRQPSGRRRSGRVGARTRPAPTYLEQPGVRPRDRPRPCRCRGSRRHGGAARDRPAAPRPRRGRAAASRPGAGGVAARSSVRSC